ncbi:hypothetical protein PMI16_04218 [Herbaspirillum sp. CF444]|nr:hypothetical protein PMI16_04218 [Herbaspirillum sp. CF444]
MPAYPPSTLKVLGNDMAALKATIGDWQNLTNRIMQNSGINARIEMYDTLLELPEPKTNKVSELLAETLAARPGFPPYDNRGKGSLWDIVRQHRDSSQSDIVLLLAADWTDNSVIGEAGSIPLPPRVDKADDLEQCTLCFCPQKAGSLEIGQVFAHELGHLLGGSHDLETLMQTGMHYDDLPMFDYVCGYQAEDRSFMTIMGYPREEEVWIPYYSDSDQTWLNPKTGKREPVGIPVGKPNAADAAAFFRESTQTVAQYRNRDRAQADSYALSMDVEPPLGGTVLPSTWGPYPQGSVQTVRALPRAGYTFDQWELDGHPAGSTQPLSFHMYSDHRVVAHFTESATRPRLSIAVVADGLQDKVAMSVNVIDRDPKNNISGPSYPFGTEIHIDCNAGASILEKYTFSGWQINGNPSLIKGYEGHHYLGSTDVYDYFFRLVVRMEQDIKAEAVFEKK